MAEFVSNMPCYTPLKGYQSKDQTANGKRKLVFTSRTGYYDKPIDVPCGQCIGCKLERSRMWAVRIKHESSLSKDNCFLTLTYDDQHLPADYSVDLRHFQLFMKRLRKHYNDKKIRYYHCGEYGETTRRPHYHVALFAHDFEDKTPLPRPGKDHPLYTSEILTLLWPYGLHSIGELTFESAAYIARYCTKKVTGEKSKIHYTYTHPLTGEIIKQTPEYASMSCKPGIGYAWFQKYGTETYNTDSIKMNGKLVKPPKYYDLKFAEENPAEYLNIKSKRIKAATTSNDAKLDPADSKVNSPIEWSL